LRGIRQSVDVFSLCFFPSILLGLHYSSDGYIEPSGKLLNSLFLKVHNESIKSRELKLSYYAIDVKKHEPLALCEFAYLWTTTCSFLVNKC
jgi:hypothetical protein